MTLHRARKLQRDLHGQNAVLKGSFFSNNGFVADSVGGSNLIVDGGSLYKGVGTTFVNVITQNGGRVQAGNSPGVSTVGSETLGLAPEMRQRFAQSRQLRLPMRPGNRSVNLSNAVAVVVFEAWRQNDFAGSA